MFVLLVSEVLSTGTVIHNLNGFNMLILSVHTVQQQHRTLFSYVTNIWK